jgi:NAD(P)-dependent dehydrogenase (short-subunit alcohol dehydrogenase family)
MALGQWAGKVALVTGATSGIGVETARALHATGADVYFTARDLQKGAATREDILKTSGGKGRLEIIELNLDSLESVRKAAKAFLQQSNTLNVLVNNAGECARLCWERLSVELTMTTIPGIMATPFSKTADGFERQFGVNHLAHFLLTSLLLPTLVASSTPKFNSRIVCLTSSAHRYSSVRVDDYNWETPGAYEPFMAYGQSKTANIWTANYIDRVYGPRGVHALAVHPGGIWSGLQDSLAPEVIAEWKANPDLMNMMQSPEQGAATSVWAAVGRVWEGKGGEYLANCEVAPPLKDATSPTEVGAAAHVHDREGEDSLWELSERLVGV